MGPPLRTVRLLIPTHPLIWPHFTPLFMCHLYMKSPPPSLPEAPWPLMKVHSLLRFASTLSLCFHPHSRNNCKAEMDWEDEAGNHADIDGDKTRHTGFFFLRKEWIHQWFSFFFFSMHIISGSVFQLILKHPFLQRRNSEKPAWHKVFNFVCMHASLCMQMCLLHRCNTDRWPGASLFTPSRTIDMSVWITWWAWNWQQLLCRNTYTCT